jgi:L,D-peptidoglycan transpeptidase YkuD (ErfK/YbiS/YcfS/YnhG family)
MRTWFVAPRRSLSIAMGAAVFVALMAPLSGVPATSATSLPGQVITVQAASALSQTAVLRTWTLTPGGHYVQVFPADLANVGVNGVRPTKEGLGRTPVGVFTLTEAFGNQPNNGTRLPYTHVGIDDWWDEDPASSHYNRLVVDNVSPGGNSENLYDAGEAYAHAVVINYNMNPVVKGAGSGFFLHVSMGVPTEGCVSIPLGDLDRVMRWLDPSAHPVISIGVGDAALAIVHEGS